MCYVNQKTNFQIYQIKRHGSINYAHPYVSLREPTNCVDLKLLDLRDRALNE